MNQFYGTLKVKYGECPSDCSLCEQACIQAKGISRLTALHVPEGNFHTAMVCNQCSEPECQAVCPVRAIEKSPDDGIVRVNEKKCIGCGMCTLACPYGGIYYDHEAHQSLKCDMCDGSPKCVEACPYDVLSYVNNEPVRSYLHDDDLLTPGATLCAGCPAELGLRFSLRILGKNTILFTAPGCLATSLMGLDTQVGTRVACVSSLLTNTASVLTGIKRYYKLKQREINVVAFVGDGATSDVGFQSLSGAAERGENIIYICYDNEGYMNTGIQRSGTTPFGAWTTTSPVGEMVHGKGENSKNMPLIMLDHGVSYVATATVAYLEDYAKKLQKAMAVKDGMSYIHLYSPCPTGWRSSLDSAIEISRIAVETNFFPLWEAEHGNIHITKEITKPKPISQLVALTGRFSHVNEGDIDHLQKLVDSNIARIKGLASLVNLSAQE